MGSAHGTCPPGVRRSSGSPELAGVAGTPVDDGVLVQQLSLAFAAEFRR